MTKRRKLLLLVPIAAMAVVSLAYTLQSDKEEAIDQMLMQSLKNVHYSPMEMNDAFSEKVFKVYLERLDYSKKFLLQSDVDELKKFNHSIDEDINNGTFAFFDRSYDLVNSRIDEAQVYYKDILSTPFDFSKDEDLQLDAEKLNFSKSKDDLKEAWRKSLKYQVLAKVYDAMDTQDKAKEKSDTVKIKTREEL